MPRTTLNLDKSVLDELRTRADREHVSLGDVASRLLAQALSEPALDVNAGTLWWHTSGEGTLVDLDAPDVLKDWAYGLSDDTDP